MKWQLHNIETPFYEVHERVTRSSLKLHHSQEVWAFSVDCRIGYTILYQDFRYNFCIMLTPD